MNANTKVIGICRYSIITHDGNSWRAGKQQSWKDYKESILNPQRLEKRLYLLKNIMLPSISGQTIPPQNDWFKLLILISSDMPSDEYNDLLEVASKYSWCQVVPVSYERGAWSKQIVKTIKSFSHRSSSFITFRIDDDDALGRTYLENLLPFGCSKYCGQTISFPKGYKAWFDSSSGRYTRVAEHWQPKIGLGLAYVGSHDNKILHVFQLGNHNKIEDKSPLMMLSQPGVPMYIRSYHGENDILLDPNVNKKIKDIFEKSSVVDQNEIDKNFSLDI